LQPRLTLPGLWVCTGDERHGTGPRDLQVDHHAVPVPCIPCQPVFPAREERWVKGDHAWGGPQERSYDYYCGTAIGCRECEKQGLVLALLADAAAWATQGVLLNQRRMELNQIML